MLRHQIIKSLIAPDTAKVAEAAVDIWEKMATEIIAIVGVGGFNSLFARSVFLSESNFPCLAASALPQHADQRFVELKKSLERQPADEAIAANQKLLCTFTDILAVLIGEELTSSILRTAWGELASIPAKKDIKND